MSSLSKSRRFPATRAGTGTFRNDAFTGPVFARYHSFTIALDTHLGRAGVATGSCIATRSVRLRECRGCDAKPIADADVGPGIGIWATNWFARN